jgi:flagellar protein FliS
MSNGQQYLEAAVRTASPARLRLMLIERAVEVARSLAVRWRSGHDLGTNELSLKLLDLFTELLSGVTGGASGAESQICRQVSDLYVFLTQHLVEAESNSCATSIDEIQIVLETEAETWRSVCYQEVSQQTVGDSSPGVSGRLNLQG